jgi:hypothetical protein
MNAVVQNPHHFCKGDKLVIKNGKITWKYSKSVDLCRCYKCDPYPVSEDISESEIEKLKQIKCTAVYDEQICDPDNSIDDFVESLNQAFRFTGTLSITTCKNGKWEKEMYGKLYIESKTNIDTLDIVKFIYDYPLEKQIKFIRIGRCGCNMGYCDAITGVDIDNTTYKTYGQVMALFEHDEGDYVSPNGKLEMCYEYPDSVMLGLERIVTLPLQIHEKHSCLGKQVDVQDKLDSNIVYLSYGYSR